MEYTPNANLKKPGYTDTVDIADINENFDTVDAHIGSGIASTDGAHGIRYSNKNQRFEMFNADKNEWVAIDTVKWGEFGTLEEASLGHHQHGERRWAGGELLVGGRYQVSAFAGDGRNAGAGRNTLCIHPRI